MEFVIFALVIVIIASVVGSVLKIVNRKQNLVSAEIELKEKNFVISQKQQVKDISFFVDDGNKKFAISNSGSVKIYKYSDILNFELNEDGNSIIQGKGLATAVGGLTFGALGAMVGASGSRKVDKVCTSLVVRILINNLENPQIIIPFISNEYDSQLYSSKIQEAKNLIATLTYIENQNISEIQDNSQKDETDEILKYKSLFDKGVITEEEFNAKKSQLLGL